MARLGVVVSTFAGISFAELEAFARDAEAAGVEALFFPEFMNDALANCALAAHATTRLKVGTWIANIYLRHPALCAETAVTLDYSSKGRLTLGLGVSHRPFVEGVLHDKMERARDYLRSYVTTVRDILTGKGYPGSPVPARAAAHPVPIHVATLALGTAELAGELADGVMLYMCPTERVAKVRAAIEKGAAKAGRKASAVEINSGIPACISEDAAAARAAAKDNFAFYGGLPFYNRHFRNLGFEREAEALAKGDPTGASDRLVDAVALVGPAARCRERLGAFRQAGIELPIIVPVAVGGESIVQATRKAIETFA